MNNIKLICNHNNTTSLDVAVTVNGIAVDALIDWTPDEYGNICLSLNTTLQDKNIIGIEIQNLNQGSTFKLVEMIADDIQFGIVTFLCTTTAGTQSTQLNCDGIIRVELESPVWQFWCTRFNEFNYKDYPLGSTD